MHEGNSGHPFAALGRPVLSSNAGLNPASSVRALMVQVPRTYADEAASNVLNRCGIAAIWRLHLSATAAYPDGKHIAARAIPEIADAAEQEWVRRVAVTQQK
jgi:hypothetical protein